VTLRCTIESDRDPRPRACQSPSSKFTEASVRFFAADFELYDGRPSRVSKHPVGAPRRPVPGHNAVLGQAGLGTDAGWWTGL